MADQRGEAGVGLGIEGWLRALLAACVPKEEHGSRGLHLFGFRVAQG